MSGLDIYRWSLAQIVKVYPSLVDLLVGDTTLAGSRDLASVTVTQGSAADLVATPSGSVTHLCMDPPYYDNVMYAELSDFFYVWEKRTLGTLYPSFFRAALTDKENEAVANPARFEAMGRRKAELATLDYESKMTAIFAESGRVLRDDGVLTVMFTHKRAEAWDTLGTSLLESGFTIETSWPVNTEAENSSHQKNLNSAASTIMLVCRKRTSAGSTGKVFLDDIEGEIRRAQLQEGPRSRSHRAGGGRRAPEQRGSTSPRPGAGSGP
jgi:adenine-specific DNA methylase